MITCDEGGEFIGHKLQKLMIDHWDINCEPVTMANPQADGIVEQTHQAIANVIQTCKLKEFCVNEKDPWKGILSTAMHAVRSDFHPTLQATPGQLKFWLRHGVQH